MRVDPLAELGDPSSAGLASWRLAIAGEIWLKSAGLTSWLKLAFYDFFARYRCNW